MSPELSSAGRLLPSPPPHTLPLAMSKLNPSQARGGLDALANASNASPRGFAPRDGTGGGAGGHAVDGAGTGAMGGGGGVRIAAGPPSEAGGVGVGRWDRERVDKRKVCYVICL